MIDVATTAPRTRRAMADEARQRGVSLVRLRAGDHYLEVDAAASEHQADALAFSGGDESQAKSAAVASGRGIPYACVPAGRDDLFARDLGIDLHDCQAALNALERYREYSVDLAEVNGVTFVNYVAIGLECAPAKVHARAGEISSPASLPSYLVTPRHPPVRLHWFASSGRESCTGIFVSNNRCPFESHAIGGRARLDGGVLGIGLLGAGGRPAATGMGGNLWHQLTLPVFEVDANGPVSADVDGQAISVEPPVRFRILPRALRARIPLSS